MHCGGGVNYCVMRSAERSEGLCALKFEDAFNPYSDRCAVSDRSQAPGLRRQLLRAILMVPSLLNRCEACGRADRDNRKHGLFAISSPFHAHSGTQFHLR